MCVVYKIILTCEFMVKINLYEWRKGALVDILSCLLQHVFSQHFGCHQTLTLPFSFSHYISSISAEHTHTHIHTYTLTHSLSLPPSLPPHPTLLFEIHFKCQIVKPYISSFVFLQNFCKVLLQNFSHFVTVVSTFVYFAGL